MPKHEIGHKVLVLGLAAIAALVIVAVVALGATEVALRIIEAFAGTGMEGAP